MTSRRLPPLHAVRAFEAAARHLSVTRAADELAVTPGAVSRHVRALEARMGQVLFLRQSSGLVLTPAGEAFALAAREGLDRIADGAQGVQMRRMRRLSVGVYGYFASRILLPRWLDLQERCPGLDVDLHTSPNPLDLSLPRHDAVIAVSDGLPRRGLVVRPLVWIETVPVCHPRWVRDGGVDFSAIPLLHARPRPDDWRRWLDHAGMGDLPGRGGSVFESIGLAIEAAAAGMGAAIAIRPLASDLPGRADLVVAHDRVRRTRRCFALHYDASLTHDSTMIAFQAWVEAICATMTGAP